MQQADKADAVTLASLIAHGLRADQIAAYRPAFDVYTLAEDAGAWVLRHADSDAALDFPPQNIAAVVCAAPVAAVAAWMQATFIDAPVVGHAPETPAVLAAMAARVRRSARFAADLTSRLAALRVAHENLQNAHEGLRAYVQERGIVLPALGFVAPPDPDGSRLPAHLADIAQTIPCDVRTLRALSLHLQQAAAGDGVLQVELTSPENPALRAEWNVDYAGLRPGWTSFVFDGVGPAVPSGAMLRLRFASRSGAPPRFSLARPHLRPDRAAWVDGDRLTRPLAFRAWTSVPGAPLTLTAQLWPAIQPGPAGPKLPARVELLDGDDFEIEDVRGLGEKLDFRPVRKLPRQHRILVHPLGPLPTIGRIPRCCPPGTVEIRVEVETDHPEAAELEYGVALAAEPLRDGLDQPTGQYRFDGPADWAVLPAKTPGTLVIALDEPLATPADLYLITRCPPGSGSDWGWAHVTRLSLIGEFAADAFQTLAAVP